MAAMLLVILLASCILLRDPAAISSDLPQLAAPGHGFHEEHEEKHNAGLDFPQAVYALAVEVTHSDCLKNACRILLRVVDPASSDYSSIQESALKATMIFTNLASGAYSLALNCSHPIVACKTEPATVMFQVQQEAESRGVISVGRMKVIRLNPIDSPQRKEICFSLSGISLLGIFVILAVQWLGLRLVSALTIKA